MPAPSSRRDHPLGLAPASVRDYRDLARRRLPRQLFDYIDGGAYEESTMDANSSDLPAIGLRQRGLRDVSERRLATTVVVKMVSLGARACLVGRAWAWAVAARGESGVAHVLQVLRDEMEGAMGLTGVTDVADLDRVTLIP
jgi:isopentenyl diphosphate isomerase/L-lactate dehydrogenase-like FMN-dependent dehydrogenase